MTSEEAAMLDIMPGGTITMKDDADTTDVQMDQSGTSKNGANDTTIITPGQQEERKDMIVNIQIGKGVEETKREPAGTQAD